VLEHYGLPPAQAFKLFLKQIADTQTVPLSFDHHANRIPNAVTHLGLYLAAIAAGTVLSAVLLGALKKPAQTA